MTKPLPHNSLLAEENEVLREIALKRAVQAANDYERAKAKARKTRQEAFINAYSAGCTQRQLAAATDMTPVQAHRIVHKKA